MKRQNDGMTEHLEMAEMLEMTVEGLGGMEMRFGWDLMAKGWSGIWFMTGSPNRWGSVGESKSGTSELGRL